MEIVLLRKLHVDYIGCISIHVPQPVKTEFEEKYARYWEQKDDESDMRRRLRIQNQQTIEHLNQITNSEIVRLAEQVRVAFILQWVSIHDNLSH